MKTARNILLILWCGFCTIGIAGNFSHYGFWDWIVISLVVIIPILLIVIIFRSKRPNSNKNNISLNNVTPLNRSPSSVSTSNAKTVPATFREDKDIFLHIPPTILALLYIKGGPLSNYNPDLLNEPSLIDISLEISSEYNPEDQFVDIGYYPSYRNLTPRQRFIYLNWLKDISAPIAIGYVFIFYYGLERQLLFGDYETAYSVLKILRKSHDNASFQAYSNDAMLLSVLFHNDIEKLCSIDSHGSEWSLRILIDSMQRKPIGVDHLIGIHRKVGFTNDRYIKICPELFKEILQRNLESYIGSNNIYLQGDDFKECSQHCTLAIANYSLHPGQRFAAAPDILTNKKFSDFVYRLLVKTHEDVKAIRDNSRKISS